MIPADFPPAVYVPCQADDAGGLNVTLRRTKDGRTALLAYSALDRLRAGAGPDVPWALLTVADLQRVHDQTPYEAIYMDLRVPLTHRAGEPA